MDNKLYISFIDTLSMILLPYKVENVPYELEIQDKLEELEGDYYTFLHKDNLMKLIDNSFISHELAGEVEIIREEITKLGRELWNVEDFIFSNEWNHIRNKVLCLIKKM